MKDIWKEIKKRLVSQCPDNESLKTADKNFPYHKWLNSSNVSLYCLTFGCAIKQYDHSQQI